MLGVWTGPKGTRCFSRSRCMNTSNTPDDNGPDGWLVLGFLVGLVTVLLGLLLGSPAVFCGGPLVVAAALRLVPVSVSPARAYPDFSFHWLSDSRSSWYPRLFSALPLPHDRRGRVGASCATGRGEHLAPPGVAAATPAPPTSAADAPTRGASSCPPSGASCAPGAACAACVASSACRRTCSASRRRWSCASATSARRRSVAIVKACAASV